MFIHLSKIQRLTLALLILGGGLIYASSAAARVCFLPDSTDCGEGDVDVPEVQITCATYGGYETEAECLEARTNKTAQACTLNSGCYYPKCAYDSERTCKNENPDKNCLNTEVDGVKCWYAQAKTCSDLGYVTSCGNNETATKVDVEASDGPCYKCTPDKECKYISTLYYGPGDTCPDNTNRKDAGVTGKDGKCSTCEAKTCADINSNYKNKDQVYQCDETYLTVFGVSGSDGQCYQCSKIIDMCLARDYKIYYVVYTDYLQGDVASHSQCHCNAYLVKGTSPNTDPVQTTAISTPGNGSTSSEKIQLPTTLTDVSSSNPYSVKIEEVGCYGEEHCSAQAVKFDVFEAYAPDTAKKLKEDDDFVLTGGVTFDEAGYYYTGRQLKPKSQNINSCDDYVVILGNGNPKACAQISSDYYNYQEACPKGYEKKKADNIYDSTGAPCYTCEKATPVITITYKETYNSLTPITGADPDEYYYKTLKFTSTSSDNVSRTIQMKTYPSKTCKTQYTTGQPVTIEENSETVIASLCGTKSEVLPVTSVAALDTFINGTKVYSFQPYYSNIISEFDGLDGTTVETNDYTVKFVKESSSNGTIVFDDTVEFACEDDSALKCGTADFYTDQKLRAYIDDASGKKVWASSSGNKQISLPAGKYTLECYMDKVASVFDRNNGNYELSGETTGGGNIDFLMDGGIQKTEITVKAGEKQDISCPTFTIYNKFWIRCTACHYSKCFTSPNGIQYDRYAGCNIYDHNFNPLPGYPRPMGGDGGNIWLNFRSYNVGGTEDFWGRNATDIMIPNINSAVKIGEKEVDYWDLYDANKTPCSFQMTCPSTNDGKYCKTNASGTTFWFEYHVYEMDDVQCK